MQNTGKDHLYVKSSSGCCAKPLEVFEKRGMNGVFPPSPYESMASQRETLISTATAAGAVRLTAEKTGHWRERLPWMEMVKVVVNQRPAAGTAALRCSMWAGVVTLQGL